MVGQVLGWARTPSPAVPEPPAPRPRRTHLLPSLCSNLPSAGGQRSFASGAEGSAQGRGGPGPARCAPGLVVLCGFFVARCSERELHFPGGIAVVRLTPAPPPPALRPAGLKVDAA